MEQDNFSINITSFRKIYLFISTANDSQSATNEYLQNFEQEVRTSITLPLFQL